MGDHTVDARGLLCPKPLILVKKTLGEISVGDRLTVLLDNETACENVLRFLKDNRCQPTSGREGGAFAIQAVKPAGPVGQTPADAACSPIAAGSPAGRVAGEPGPAGRPPVLVLNQQGMGFGSEELGRLLIQACLNAVKEVKPLPSTIVFYNGGAHLACEGSPVLATLEELEKRGVRLLVCGTCLEYYDLKAKRKVGTVSNMYEIMQTLATAGTVIHP